MKTKILAALLLTLPLMANAEWVTIGSSLGSDYKIKTETVSTVKGRHSMVVQKTDSKDDQVLLLLISVPDTACKAQMGQLHTSKLNGEQPTDHDFVFGGESMGSLLAEKLCTLAGK